MISTMIGGWANAVKKAAGTVCGFLEWGLNQRGRSNTIKVQPEGVNGGP